MFKLNIDKEGEAISSLKFDTQLEMAKWLLDAGFKTQAKTETGILYYRVQDKTCAVWMFEE